MDEQKREVNELLRDELAEGRKEARRWRYVALFLLQDLGGEVRIPFQRFVGCPKDASIRWYEDPETMDLVLTADGGNR